MFSYGLFTVWIGNKIVKNAFNFFFARYFHECRQFVNVITKIFLRETFLPNAMTITLTFNTRKKKITTI